MSSVAANRLVGIRTKIERAKQHIRDLEVRVRAFLETDPYPVVAENDPESRGRVYRVGKVSPIPADLAVVAGDAINNLRAALEHLAWQLVLANMGTPTKDTGFPIFEDASKYEAGRAAKVKGMSDAAVDLIDAAKPYRGGNDGLWRLHRLNNIDKHRLLITIGMVHQAIIIDTSAMLRGSAKRKAARTGWAIPEEILRAAPRFVTIPARSNQPLQEGAEFTKIIPAFADSAVDNDPQFTFTIAFNEPQIAEGEPVLETLHQLAHLVDGVVGAFVLLL